MMIAKNIVLMGFMGSGKTSLAQLLHVRYGLVVQSTDKLIEANERMSINEIFEKKGESYFRQCEHRVVQQLAHERGIVIDCGGGIVLNPANITALKASGMIFFLDANEDILYDRLKHQTDRPLLRTPDPLTTIRQLLTQRRPLYLAAADAVIDANDPSLEPALDQILRFIQ